MSSSKETSSTTQISQSRTLNPKARLPPKNKKRVQKPRKQSWIKMVTQSNLKRSQQLITHHSSKTKKRESPPKRHEKC